ncbi:hypothetical protein CKO24_06905 [Rhodothalassium salexigens DSM 2132]|nr:hypothetical protein [Rhodothalassium salexigens DSM 2132]
MAMPRYRPSASRPALCRCRALAAGLFLGIGGAMAATAQDNAIDAHDVYGRWLTEDDAAVITVRDCGDGSPCGTMTWLNPDTTDACRDRANPEAALQDRPLLGLVMLDGFERGEDGWRRGQIYHAERGKTYRALIRRTGADSAQVKGCLAFFCQSQDWTRAPDTLAQSACAAEPGARPADPAR